MSDEQTVDTITKVGSGALVGSPLLLLFVKRIFRKSDEEKAALVAAIAKLEANLEKLSERVEGGLGDHRAQLKAEGEARHQLALKVQDHESRLLTREGLRGEPMTNPGHKLTPEMLAAIARIKEEP